MGDWGGQSAYPYTTSDEVKTAKSLKEQKAKYDVPLTLALGDNFYDNGVKDSKDARFQETFENVFDKSLDNFHVLAGNHDYNGNVNAEVEYSSISERWNFPSLYYTWTENLDSGAEIQFVFMDSCSIAGTTPHHSEKQCQDDPESCRVASLGSSLDGADVDQQFAQDQWDWAKETMANSTAAYLVVAAHYPVWSIAEHGPTAALVDKLMPLLQEYEATAYLCGHDHSAQHIRDPNDKANVDYHVIGAAHLVDGSTAHKDSIPKNSLLWHSGDPATGGMFGRISVNSTSFVVHHYANSGQLLYSSPPKGPRSKTH